MARAERTAQRFYSLSTQILRECKQYVDPLEATQRGTLGVMPWLSWFLTCLLRDITELLARGILGAWKAGRCTDWSN